MSYHNDKPIFKSEEDIFKREPIAQNISDFIVHRSCNTSKDSYCIGIYGKWGEGKTSLANIIEEKLLQNKKDNIVIAKYNPWLLKDQESILYDFFNTISKEDLGLETIKCIKEYGALVSLGLKGISMLTAQPLLATIGFSLEKLIKVLPNHNQSVSKLKEKVNKSIIKSGKHLVVFVDDLDRLDKVEIHSVLKLIRQNTDFVNTTYVLMMDYVVVSNSLQSFYSECDDNNSGQKYLKKIVQFPLHLPVIQEQYLESFLFDKLNSLFESLNINEPIYIDAIIKTKEDIKNFVLPLFSTPREIIQYINVLKFVVPIMYKELNLSDLCLLEALKETDYNCYTRLWVNRYSIFNIDIDLILKSEEDAKIIQREKIKKNVEKIIGQSDYHSQGIINHLLYDYIQSNYMYSLSGNNKLSNKDFFEKYFIYDTPQNMISEKEIIEIEEAILNKNFEDSFKIFIEKCDGEDTHRLKRVVNTIIDKTNRYSEQNIAKVAENICFIISNMEIVNQYSRDCLKGESYANFLFNEVFRKLQITDINNRKIDISGSKISTGLIKSIIEKIYKDGGLIFSVCIHSAYLKYEYLGDEYGDLFKILINRFIEEKSELDIFNFPDPILKKSIICSYHKYLQKEYFISRDNVMQDENVDVVRLVYSFLMEKRKENIEELAHFFELPLLIRKIKDIDLSGDLEGYKDTIDYLHKNL